MLAMRTGQGHFFAGLSGHALEFQVKVKAFAALGALQTIHFPLRTKLQTNLKFQYSMTKTALEFRILVIVICLIFVIWNFYSFSALPSTV
jgi:hypothetical protein